MYKLIENVAVRLGMSLLLSSLTVQAFAQGNDTSPTQDGASLQNKDEMQSRPTIDTARPATLPLWEVGVSGFALSRTAYPGSDTYLNRTLIIPYFFYRGEHLRVDRGGSGYRAVKTPTLEVDVGFSATVGSSSDKVQARRGMERIGHMIEFGPRLNWTISEPSATERWRIELPVRGAFDVSDGFRRRGISFEPDLTYTNQNLRGWRYASGISAVWGSQAMADVFYTVRPDQVLIDRPAYRARAGLITWRVSSTLLKQIDRDWRFLAGLRIESVVGAANEASPLVRKKTAPSLVFGLTYTFRQSERPANE